MERELLSTKTKIDIFDTTLRDGQQCPGAGMSIKQNLQYARLAADLGIDVLEAGFPAASKLDYEIVFAIASEINGQGDLPSIAALCQLRDEQVDITIEALTPAIKPHGRIPRLHTYVPVDPALMVASLGEKADKSKIVRDVFEYTKRATQAGLEVEFSPEGYSRMGQNFSFTTDLICAAIEGGARVINCPDTIGGASRYQGAEYFVQKMKEHAAIVEQRYPNREVIWSVHCHNDFGLAVENSVNGVFSGPARQIEGCFNGIGERAGNAALEQVLLVIQNFGSQLPEKFFTGVKLQRLQEISDFVAHNMLPRQPHWPVTGDNAAKHSAGGHTNAVLQDPLVYQPFNPLQIGKKISLVFGPLSGSNHAQSVIVEAGYLCSDAEKSEISQFIKNLFSDRRKGITDQELVEGYIQYRSPIQITDFNYSRKGNRSEIQCVGKFFDHDGHIFEHYEGRDSALAALKVAIDSYFPVAIQSHQSQSDGQGIDAVSLSTIVIKDERGNLVSGNGRDQDIEISAMRALVDAVNRAYVTRNFRTSLHNDSYSI